ncbi:MAG: DUF4173 domain-containing protein [Acidobacteriia bacterium]|nr:DUF4173 domain-containing protein [Terriglobia bacterium]
MDQKTPRGLKLIAFALTVGLWADVLLRPTPWGLNFPLWILAGCAVVLAARRWRDDAFARNCHWLLLSGVLFSFGVAWRDALTLKLLDIFSLLVVLSLLMLRAQGGTVLRSSLAEYGLGSVLVGLNAAFGSLALLSSDISWRDAVKDRGSQHKIAVVKGVLIALPLLLLFGGLLTGADAIFSHFIKDIFHINVESVFSHLFMVVLFAWLAGGFLRGLIFGTEIHTVKDWHTPTFSLGIIEIGIVLTSLNVLFLSFVLVQVRYLFGGAQWIQVSPGLTYAEYARRGFFELVAVAALVLPLLLACHWLMPKEQPSQRRVFGWLAGFQLALVFVIMISALERMVLYQQEYGLTEQRFYTTTFMAWLAVVFLWFSVTVLRGRREHFAFGAMMAGFLLVFTLHIVNPDQFIARVNLSRENTGHPLDAGYVASLSADAVPEMIRAIPKLSAEHRALLASRILKRWSPQERMDWRTWSWARSRAMEAVRRNQAILI